MAMALAAVDPVQSARDAGLHYVSCAMSGIRRLQSRGEFRYVDAQGCEITDPDERLRIKALGIPPAWSDVWICADPRGHVQATGRDARGRKQYRYHAEYRQVRDEAKFARLVTFARALPGIRRRVEQDLAEPGISRSKVLAALIRLLEETLIRVGNDEYARANESYGLTTMQDGHVEVSSSQLRFTFRGKSGKDHSITLRDARLARIVKRCRDIPGERLFQYQAGDGTYRPIYSEDVNGYLREITGQEFSAKDFRTWFATVLAAEALSAAGGFTSKREARHQVNQAIDHVAGALGNTRAVCRKCYVHPAVVDAYLKGGLRLPPAHRKGLEPAEARTLAFLEQASQAA